jgi:hypothetical protein
MMQQPALVIEAEEERSDLVAVAIIAKAAHHAVGRAPALDFEHGALAGAIGQVQALGDNPVEGCVPPFQPLLGHAQLTGEGRQSETMGLAADLPEEPFERFAAFRERPGEQRLPGPGQQAIEEDQGGRCCARQAADAALCRMQPHLQRIEGELAIEGDDELGVEHECRTPERPQVREHLGKEARQRLAGFGFELDLGA